MIELLPLFTGILKDSGTLEQWVELLLLLLLLCQHLYSAKFIQSML